MSNSVAAAMTDAREHRSERMSSPKLALSVLVRSLSSSSFIAFASSSVSSSVSSSSSTPEPLNVSFCHRSGQSSRNARSEETHAWTLLSRVWNWRVSIAASPASESRLALAPRDSSHSRARAVRTSDKHADSCSSAYHRSAPPMSVSTPSACSRAKTSWRRSIVSGNAAAYASRSAAKESARDEECMAPLSGATASSGRFFLPPRSRAEASRSAAPSRGRSTTSVSSIARRTFWSNSRPAPKGVAEDPRFSARIFPRKSMSAPSRAWNAVPYGVAHIPPTARVAAVAARASVDAVA